MRIEYVEATMGAGYTCDECDTSIELNGGYSICLTGIFHTTLCPVCFGKLKDELTKWDDVRRR